MLFLASTNTILQMIVPDKLRGRVMSLYMLDRGFMPAGALFAGVTAHFIGAPCSPIMGAIVIVLALVVAWHVPANSGNLNFCADFSGLPIFMVKLSAVQSSGESFGHFWSVRV